MGSVPLDSRKEATKVLHQVEGIKVVGTSKAIVKQRSVYFNIDFTCFRVKI